MTNVDELAARSRRHSISRPLGFAIPRNAQTIEPTSALTAVFSFSASSAGCECVSVYVCVWKKRKLVAYAMERVAASAHLPTDWLFEPAKRPDDRADYYLDCSFEPLQAAKKTATEMGPTSDNLSPKWPVGFTTNKPRLTLSL